MAFKERVFSGMQPTGNLHLGNYLGAILNSWSCRIAMNASIAWSTCTPSPCGRTRRNWPRPSAT